MGAPARRASFFPSIHKRTLYDILCGAIRDPELQWLTATILFHDPTRDFVFHKGPRFVPHPGSPHYPVESSKSLFGRVGLRRIAHSRGIWAFGVGFPVRAVARHARAALEGWSVAMVCEGEVADGVRAGPDVSFGSSVRCGSKLV